MVRAGTASLWLSSSATSAAKGALGDFVESWMDAFPEERDDKELLFFMEEDAESKCLFFKSPATITVSVAISYKNCKTPMSNPFSK